MWGVGGAARAWRENDAEPARYDVLEFLNFQTQASGMPKSVGASELSLKQKNKKKEMGAQWAHDGGIALCKERKLVDLCLTQRMCAPDTG